MTTALYISVLQTLYFVIELYMWVIIIAALLTWVRPDPYNPIVQTLYRLTEPAYKVVRRFLPTIIGGIDLTPLIIIIGLKFLMILLQNLMMVPVGL